VLTIDACELWTNQNPPVLALNSFESEPVLPCRIEERTRLEWVVEIRTVQDELRKTGLTGSVSVHASIRDQTGMTFRSSEIELTA
jgi:hypothetical protein